MNASVTVTDSVRLSFASLAALAVVVGVESSCIMHTMAPALIAADAIAANKGEADIETLERQELHFDALARF